MRFVDYIDRITEDPPSKEEKTKLARIAKKMHELAKKHRVKIIIAKAPILVCDNCGITDEGNETGEQESVGDFCPLCGGKGRMRAR